MIGHWLPTSVQSHYNISTSFKRNFLYLSPRAYKPLQSLREFNFDKLFSFSFSPLPNPPVNLLATCLQCVAVITANKPNEVLTDLAAILFINIHSQELIYVMIIISYPDLGAAAEDWFSPSPHFNI